MHGRHDSNDGMSCMTCVLNDYVTVTRQLSDGMSNS